MWLDHKIKMSCTLSSSPHHSSHSSWLSTRSASHFKFMCFSVILLQVSVGVTIGYVTTAKPYTESEICECPCIASALNISHDAPSSVKEAVTKAEEIEKELTVDKSTTSSTTRTKVSVQDERPSAKYVGVLGIVFISLVFGSIVLLDLLSCGKEVKKEPSNKTKKNKRQNKTAPAEDGDPAAAADEQGVDNKSFQDLSKEESSSGSARGEVPSKGNDYSSSPDSEFYSNRYLGVPYSSAPLLVNRSPLSARSGTKDSQLRDRLGHEDMSNYDAAPETIRIRALVPPYQSTSNA